MLPADSRLTHRDDFTAVLRRGRKSGRANLVVHVHRAGQGDHPRAGFVVSKAVGNAVTRHRVARRLRHVTRPCLEALPTDTMIVVRALPPSATATSEELARDLDAGLRGALRKLGAVR